MCQIASQHQEKHQENSKIGICDRQLPVDRSRLPTSCLKRFIQCINMLQSLKRYFSEITFLQYAFLDVEVECNM